MQIRAIVVALPNLDPRIFHRVATGVEYLAAKVRNLSDSRRQTIVDHDQVIVGIERQLVRIKRPFGLSRRFQQLLRKRAGDKPGGRANGDSAKKRSPRANGATGKL